MKRLALPVVCVLALLPAALLAGFRDRVRPMPFGVSGAPDGVRYSGTMGALITDGTKNYILSTATVLSNAWRDPVGTLIVQPSAADRVEGGPLGIVAHLSAVARRGDALHPGGDAALAEVVLGRVDRSGAILQNDGSLRLLDPLPIWPVLGTLVEKSGRTTQVTSGKVKTVVVTLRICDPHGRDPLFVDHVFAIYPEPLTSQVFSESGDSGALVVTAGSRRPMGLLVAHSNLSGLRVGYAVDATETLRELDRVTGKSLTFVGAGRSARGEEPSPPVEIDAVPFIAGIPEETLAALVADETALEKALMLDDPSCTVQAIGIGEVPSGGHMVPALMVYVTDPEPFQSLRFSPNGYPIVLVLTSPIVAN
jgi:hypothetical protein